MQDAEWVIVFETAKMHEALMVQSVLQEHHINAVLLNQQDSSYVTVGEISLYVALKDSVEALNIVDQLSK